MTDKGFIVLDRAIEDWQWWGDMNGLGLWIHILHNANWKDGWFMGNRISRGSFATSIKSLAEETDLSESTVKRWLKKFESAHQISTKATNRYTVITVINYAKYQDCEVTVNNQMTEQVNHQVTYQMTDQVTEQVNHNRTNKQSNKETIIKKKEEFTDVNSKKEKPRFVPPTVEEVREYCDSRHSVVDPEAFVAFYESKNWMVGRNKMSSWKSAVITWEKKEQERRNTQKPKQRNLLDDLPF